MSIFWPSKWVEITRPTFNAMVMVQDQTETLASTMLNQSTGLPEAGQKAISEWVDAFRKDRDVYKKTVDEAFTRAEEFF